MPFFKGCIARNSLQHNKRIYSKKFSDSSKIKFKQLIILLVLREQQARELL